MTPFRIRLAALALLGLVVRLGAAWANRAYPVVGDALTYHLEAGFLADGEGFRRAFEDVPTAEHPPGHIVVLALAELLGIGSTAGQKAFLGLVGTGTVVLTGLLGRRIGGERVGLLAAGLAAIYPMLFLADAALMSESTSTLLVVACALAAFRLHDRPGLGAAALLGAVIALAALTRGEALGLLVLLAAPIIWKVRAGRRVRLGLACLAAFVLVLAPWSVRNALTFERPVLLSTNGDGVWTGANCEETYYGEAVGAWVFSCFGVRPPGDEAEEALVYRERGLRYARENAGRVPVVVAARVGRLLDVYRPWSQGVFFAGVEGRRPRAHRVGLLAYWALLPFAVAGAVLLRRRRARAELLVVLAPVVLVLLVAALVYGTTRFRTAAEPSLVVLAAVALVAGVDRARSARGPKRS